MKYLEIKLENRHILKEFIDGLGSEKLSFRYYNTRSIDIIENHSYTCLLLNERNIPVCYGHIDKEDEIYWLGIVTKNSSQKQGLGKKMMTHLIYVSKLKHISRISLSCDSSNQAALNLYKKFGFKQNKINNNLIFMQKILD